MVLVWLLCAALAHSAGAADAAPASPEQLLGIIEKGGFDERQDALKQLEALGEKARQALEKAARESELFEVRATAARLLGKLSQASVAVQLIDLQGQPVADVPLQVQVRQPTPLPSPLVYSGAEEEQPPPASTDAKGQATWTHLVPGSALWCGTEGPAQEPWNWQLWYLRPGENRLTLVRHRGGTVAGSVVAEDGKPLAAATLSLIPDWGQDPHGLDPQKTLAKRQSNTLASGVSDAAGRFALEHVPAGSYLLFAEHPDCAVACAGVIRVCEAGRTDLPTPLRLASRAAAYGTLRVLLLDEQGQPLDKATVSVTLARTPGPAQPPATPADKPSIAPDGLAARQAWLRYTLATSDNSETASQTETAEAGCLELPNLWPGEYQVTVRAEEEGKPGVRKYQLRNLIVAADQAAGKAGGPQNVFVALPPVACGSISGQLASAAGKSASLGRRVGEFSVWALAEDDPDARAVLSDLTRYESWFGRWQENLPDFGVKLEDESFALKDLVPGRYTLVIVEGKTTKGVMHGVEVAAGRETKLPAFRLPGHDKPLARSLKDAAINGTVLLPNGEPAQRANVVLLSAEGGWSQTCSTDKGVFNLVSVTFDDDEHVRLSASLAGFRTCHADLPLTGLPLRSVVLQFEAEDAHGSIAATVVDAQGQPLKGALAAVQPLEGAGYSQNNGAPGKPAVTDAAGRVVLPGLAYGQRRIEVLKEGYYLPEPETVQVLPNKVTAVKVTMQRALALAGRIAAPAGTDTAKGMVSLEYAGLPTAGQYGWHHCFAAPVDEAGRFQFSGLRPGKVSLSALYPGLLGAQERTELELAAGALPDVQLQLVRSGALKLDLGPENRGARLALMAPGSWDPARGLNHNLPQECLTETTADSLGRAELRDLRPGSYDLLVRPAYEEDAFHYTQHACAARVCPGIRVAPLPGGPEALEKLEPVRLKPGQGGSEVRGRVVLRNVAAFRPGEKDLGRLRVTLANEQAVGSIDFYLPDDLDPQLEPRQVGRPAQGFLMVPQDLFRIAAVPPGEYRLYLEYELPERQWPWRERQRFNAAAGPAKTIQVASATVTAADDIAFEIGTEMLERLRRDRREETETRMRRQYGAAEGEDLGPEFQP